MRPQERSALIERALDLGISHFDTARFYSDGLSELTLGRTLGPRRKSVTIATKFGLLPTPLIASAGRFGWPLRKFRSVLSKTRIVPYPLRSYAAATMRSSLEASLRALCTDYVDILHVHEPLAETELGDDLIEELLRAKAAGWVRHVGVSGTTIDAIVQRHGPILDVLQTAEWSWSEARFVPDITHSLFSRTQQASRTPLSSDTVRELLERALRRRPDGAVVVQTRNPNRLSEIVELAGGRSPHGHQAARTVGANGKRCSG